MLYQGNSHFLPTTRIPSEQPKAKEKRSSQGFTLIELLIVIAIILILIAIALPNFLEAQMRARVAKVKGEIRSLGIAQESYFLDFGIYPAESEDDAHRRGKGEQGLFWLTSPIPYITTVPTDPFGQAATRGDLVYYETGGIVSGRPPCASCLETWVIFTRGPDGNEGEIRSANPHYEPGAGGTTESYSPTNGTKSNGDIFQWGGDGFWVGVAMSQADRGKYRQAPSSFDVGIIINGRNYLHQLPPPLQ